MSCSSSGDNKRPPRRAPLSLWARLLPDCGTALDLAKTGSERPLKLHESLSLRYNSVLCLYCQCARERFDRSLGEMREAARLRSGK